MGLESSTPEIQLSDEKVNVLDNLEIAHTDVTGQQRVLITNPDEIGWIRFSDSG